MDKVEQQEPGDEELMIPLDVGARLAPFIERYFVRYYKAYEAGQMHYAFHHTNKLFMIGITQQHAIFRSQALVVEVSFSPIGVSDSRTFVKGKKKKGGIKIHSNHTIALVTMDDGSKYEVKGVVDGYIIEINENLLINPTYLQNYPESKGFVAFVNPFGSDRKQKCTLMDHTSYLEQLK